MFTGLDRVARKTGFPVEETPGWAKAGHGGMDSCSTIIVHHTAGANNGKDYNSYNTVKYGRPGLPGPLAQMGVGRNTGTIYLFGAGRAWHAGKVGKTAHNNNNALGIEIENNGVGEKYSDNTYRASVALVGELVKEFKLNVDKDVLGHKEVAIPRGRKIDPSFSMGKFRADVKAYIAGDIKPQASKPKPVSEPKPQKKSGKKDQSPSNLPDGSTTFPDNYADLPINGLFQLWEVGALQILLNNILGSKGKNKQWDGKFGKLTVTDTMTLMQRNGYYLKTPFAARGVAKGTPLNKDGVDGYWFWVEFQRMLGDDEGNRGKVYYDLRKWRLDGKPEKETGKAIQRWLNDNN